MQNTILELTFTGLHCGACKKIIEKRLNSLKGILEATVDLETGKGVVKASGMPDKKEIEALFVNTDYQLQNYRVVS